MAKTLKDLIYGVLTKFISRSLTDVKTVFVSDTNARTGIKGYAIKAIEDTVIAAVTYEADPSATSNTLVGETIAKGDTWYLKNITAVTLTSGAAFVLIH